MPKPRNVSSSSDQAGAATRGNEAGSSSEVVSSGAGAGVAASGAESQYGSSGSETISDISQAEAVTRTNVRGAQIGAGLDAFLAGSLARLTQIGEQVVQRTADVGHLITTNAVAHSKNMDSLNQHLRENSLKQDDKTDSIDLAVLANQLAKLGMSLKVVPAEDD